MIALKAWREEDKGRTELLFTTPTSRRAYLAAYGILALIASVVIPLLAAFGMWGASALVMSDPLSAGFYFKAIAVYLPAIWVLTALAFFLIAIRPHFASGITWGYYAFAFLMGYFGDLFPNLPNWVQNLSVLGMSPNITQEKIPWLTLSIMTALAVTLMVAAFIFYQDRDLENA
jgi:ABC-2 type transport system permease protein